MTGPLKAAAASVTGIADRESDIFEAFALRPRGVELVIRAAHDRSVQDGQALFAAVDAVAEAGRADLDLRVQLRAHAAVEARCPAAVLEADLGEDIVIESRPRLEGRQMVMMIAPQKK